MEECLCAKEQRHFPDHLKFFLADGINPAFILFLLFSL
jgi:hypothetical protein